MTGLRIYTADYEPRLVYGAGDDADRDPAPVERAVRFGDAPLDLLVEFESPGGRVVWSFRGKRGSEASRTEYYLADFRSEQPDLFRSLAADLAAAHDDGWIVPHVGDLRWDLGFELWRVPAETADLSPERRERLFAHLDGDDSGSSAGPVVFGMCDHRSALAAVRAIQESGTACIVAVGTDGDPSSLDGVDLLLQPGGETNFEPASSGARAALAPADPDWPGTDGSDGTGTATSGTDRSGTATDPADVIAAADRVDGPGTASDGTDGPGTSRDRDAIPGDDTDRAGTTAEGSGRTDTAADGTARTGTTTDHAERSGAPVEPSRSRLAGPDVDELGLASRFAGAALLVMLVFAGFSFVSRTPVHPITGLATVGGAFGTIAALIGVGHRVSADRAGGEKAFLLRPMPVLTGREEGSRDMTVTAVAYGTFSAFLFPTVFRSVGRFLTGGDWLLAPVSTMPGAVLQVPLFVAGLYLASVGLLAVARLRVGEPGWTPETLRELAVAHAVYGVAVLLTTGLAGALWYSVIPATGL